MPSSIPYDHPSLVLGNIVDTRVVDLLKQISNLQSKTEAAQEKMNSLVMMKRSLAMTLNELIDMGIDPSSVKEKLAEIDESITQSASDYVTVRLENEDQIHELKVNLYSLDDQCAAASPLDFTLSKVTALPLSAESIKIDVQYFTFGSNSENDTLANIEKYVKDATADLGQKSNEITSAVSGQINQQMQNHSLSGTLIITASCTHKNVAIINPFVIDIDNAVDIWNATFPSDQILVDPTQTFSASSPEGDEQAQTALTVLSGAAYGSSFVGMVHFLKTDTAQSNVDDATMQKLKDKLRVGGWLENLEGGMGVDSSVMNEVKKLLSTQTFASHVSLVVMGTTPSIASGKIKLGLNKILQSDTDKNAALLTALSQATETDMDTTTTEATEAKTAGRLMKLQQGSSSALIKGLSDIDHGTNKTIDINSLMGAFENYLETIKGSNNIVGVPVNFFFKKITRAQIVKKLLEKYKSDTLAGAAAKPAIKG
jgi:hypothetical protein